MSEIHRLSDEFIRNHVKKDSGLLASSTRAKLDKIHSFLFSPTIPDSENRAWIAYLAMCGKVDWSRHYRGTSLEDVRFYDNFSRQQRA